MKKILFYIRSYYGGGAEKVMLDYIRRMDKRRFDITVFVRTPSGLLEEQFRALEKEGVHLRRCCDWIKPGNNLFHKGINWLLLTVADRTEFRFPAVFHRIAIREKFDVEIAFMHNEAAAIVASSPNRKSKKFLWVHTDLRKIGSWKMYFQTRKRQRRFFSTYDQCFCVSQVAEESVQELLGPLSNLEVLHNPLDRDSILKLSETPCPLEKTGIPTVCAVGRLNSEKNFEMLLRAHANVRKKGIAHRVCIVGEGPEREKLEALIESLDIKDTAILAGYQSNPYPYIKNADFLALSSFYEGFPTVIMEALALGKPVVATCKVVEEVFGDYACGIVTGHDQAALEQGIEKMLTDPAYRDRCAAEAQKRGQAFNLTDSVRYLENRIEENQVK